MILHASEALLKKKAIRTAYIDLLGCRTPSQFLELFASSVLKAASSLEEERLSLAGKFLSELAPKAEVLPHSSLKIEFSRDLTASEGAFEAVLSLPEKIGAEKGLRFLVWLDEFQQVSEFEDSKAFLRQFAAAMGRRKNTAYWISGCRKPAMETIFQGKDSPFFGFADILPLGEIRAEEWERYLVRRFADAGKRLPPRLAREIAGKAGNHPYYVQQLAWLLWTTEAPLSYEEINRQFEALLLLNEPLFIELTQHLTSRQLNFLKALASGKAKGFSELEALRKYDLGSSSNVARVLSSLEDKEIVIHSGPGEARFADPLYAVWFRRKFCAS